MNCFSLNVIHNGLVIALLYISTYLEVPFCFLDCILTDLFFFAVLSLCILEQLCYTDDVFDAWKRNYIHWYLTLLGASQYDGA